MNDENPTFQQPAFAPEPQDEALALSEVQDQHRADNQALATRVVPGAVATVSPNLFPILATKKYEGEWVVPESLNVSTFMGTAILDFTDATFTSPEVVIDLRLIMGTLKIFTPAGLTVIDDSNPIMGEVTTKNLGRPDPGMPKLVLRGMLVMSSVAIRGPKISLLDRINGKF